MTSQRAVRPPGQAAAARSGGRRRCRLRPRSPGDRRQLDAATNRSSRSRRVSRLAAPGWRSSCTSSVDSRSHVARQRPGSEPGGLFADCQPFAPGTYTAGAGVYLLTIGPAQQSDGLAPSTGSAIASPPATSPTDIQTVQFRLIRLALDRGHARRPAAPAQPASPTSASRHERSAGFSADPLGLPPTTYGLLDELRAQTISDDEVPLCHDRLGGRRGNRVRRPVVGPPPRDATGRRKDRFAAFAGDRRRAEGEAMFLQFQDAVSDLRNEAGSRTRLSAEQVLRLPAGRGSAAEGDRVVDGLLTRFSSSPASRPRDRSSSRAAASRATAASLVRGHADRLRVGSGHLALRDAREQRSRDRRIGGGPAGSRLHASASSRYAANAQSDISHFDYANYAVRGW